MLQSWATAVQAGTASMPGGQLSLQLEQQTRAQAAHLLSQAATAYQEVLAPSAAKRDT